MDYLQALAQSITIKVQAANPLILAGVTTLLYWLVLSHYNSEAWKLRQFPSVGSTLPFISLIGTFRFAKNAHNVVATGRRRFPGRIFKVPTPTEWLLVITDPTLVDDIRKAPENILSAQKAVDESLQAQFTLGSHIIENPTHVPIVRTRLTKAIPSFIPEVYDEVVEACNQYLPAEDDAPSVLALENMMTIIARVSNRILVGPVLCRNPDWIKLCIDFTMYVVTTALLLRLSPRFLRPVLNRFASRKAAQRNRDGLKHLGPVITARRKEQTEKGTESSNDFLSWLMEEAKGEEKEDWAILSRIMTVNFAAIHTSSMGMTQALFDLLSNPEYLNPLREEVEEVIKREGWTKAGLDQMHKLDSFVKESQRLHPIGNLMLARYAMVDFTFSDGSCVPAGTVVTVPASSIHLDPDTYEDPLRFDGFRFIKMKERAALDGHPDKKFDIVTINAEFVAFGQGRHACPGRFFASAEIKLLLAYIVTTYDVKLADGNARPPNWVHMNSNIPNPTAKVFFRRRQ